MDALVVFGLIGAFVTFVVLSLFPNRKIIRKENDEE